MSEQNIFEVLRSEHDRQRSLMDQLERTRGASPERERLFLAFVEETEAHAAAEELVFYSRLLGDDSARGQAAHSVEEHQGMREGVEALRELDMASSGWLQRFAVVRERFEHHLEEEEHGVFQLAGKVLDEHEKTDLVEAYLAARRKELID